MKERKINMTNIYNSTKVITGVNTRWSYCNVWEPKSINGGTPKYSVSLIIPKSDTVTVEKIKKAIEAAYKEGESKLRGTGKSVPALEAIKTPLRDGDIDRAGDEDYAGCYFLNATSIQPVGIVDRDCNPILDHSEVYSGIRGRVALQFYCFNNSGNRGIAVSVSNVQKWSDGPALGNKSTPEEDFGGLDDDDEFLS